VVGATIGDGGEKIQGSEGTRYVLVVDTVGGSEGQDRR
jgi:hypothetical protein